MPPLSWPGAQEAGGTRIDLDLETVHCDQDYETIHFFVGTGWCSACPDYLRRFAAAAPAIEAAGGLVVYIEVEDASYRSASNESAANVVNRHVGDAPGVRVGDGDTQPSPGALQQAPIVGSYPAAFVVRTRDMRIIASQETSQQMLELEAIARDPERLWSGRQARCAAADEEPLEPNDSPYEPGVLRPGRISGGVCGSDMDFFHVDVRGRWRMDLTFRHADGDLDTYLWDPETNGPAVDDQGRRIGSDSTSDRESFEHDGPATIVVLGFQLATAAYDLTVTEL